MSQFLSQPAKLLLLAKLLAKDGIITNNCKAFFKELILRGDERVDPLLEAFTSSEKTDVSFLERVHDVVSSAANELYDELFADTPLEVGKALSSEERQITERTEEKSLIYGEVEFDSFYRILRKINHQQGGVFYDLGSGTGKALFVSRFTQDFDRVVGIEILQGLHERADTIVRRFNNYFKDRLWYGSSQKVEVYEGSFLDFNWSDGDVVFANSTCFDDDLLQQLSYEAEKLKPGTIFVTFTKGLRSAEFEVLERKRYGMSWGPATVYIQRRLGYDGKPVGPPNLNILPSDAEVYEGDIHLNYKTSYVSDDDSGYSLADIDYDIRDVEENSEEDDESQEEEEEEGEEQFESDNEQVTDELGNDINNTPQRENSLHAVSTEGETDQFDFNLLSSPMDNALLKRKHQRHTTEEY